MADGEDSSGLDSSNEESYEEETQPVVTQHDVFGSDTDSEDNIPVVKDSKRKTVPADESSAGEEEEETDQEEVEDADDLNLPRTAPPSSHSRSRRQRPASEQSASGDDSETSPPPSESRPQKKQMQSRRSVGHNLFSEDSEQEEEGDVADNASDAKEGRKRTLPEGDREEEEEDSKSDDANDVQEGSEVGDVDEEEEEEEDIAELDETKIAVDFPLIRTDLGKEIYLVKMPNFLSVETRPFDPVYYEDELDEDEVMDEEGRTRLKLKVENTIRWRKSAENENVHESNARIVKWSDGSLSLHLGDEIFDIHKVDIHADYNFLFIREGSGLQGQSALRTKLTFRPHSTDSFTHRKITLSLADKTNKSQKVKILPIAGADPETNRSQLVRREEEKLRASLRRESQLRRMRERQAISRGNVGERRRVSSGSGGVGAVYEEDYDDDGAGEDEEEDDGNTTSLNALKRNAKEAFKASRKEVSGIYSSDSESLSDISEQISRKKIRATISDEESA